MKNKKSKYIIAAIIGIVVIVIIFGIRTVFFPKLSMGKEIVKILQPILETENQSMHLDVEADIYGKTLNIASDISLVKENEKTYLILEQGKHSFYITDNILFLENGNAYKIAEETQNQTIGYEKLFSLISSVYEEFAITKNEHQEETWYEVTVMGEQVNTLLQIFMPTEENVSNVIENLQVRLVTKNETLHRLEFFGKANDNNGTLQVEVTISDFQSLQANHSMIPDFIEKKVENVDKESLLSLTEDFYRLLMAITKLAEAETLNGTLFLQADCEILQINKQMDLAELQSGISDIQHAPNISVLLETVEVLCMEGNIACEEENGTYVYTLILDKDSMQKITAKMIPEIVDYAVTFTEGSIQIRIENERIHSIKIGIDGTLRLLIMELPIEISAKLLF